MVNILFDTVMLVPAYGTIAKIPVTFPPRPHAQESLTRIDFYMNGVISTVQGGAKRRHQVSDGTVCDLKWILLSLSGDIKDLLSVKNLLVGEGDWTCIKEVLGWTVDMKAVTGTLLERNLQEHFILLALPATQR